MFKIGDPVKWSSQAGGRIKQKTGEVVFVVPVGGSSWELDEEKRYKELMDTHKVHFDGVVLSARNHESYLVSVKDGKTDKAKKSLYWPRVTFHDPGLDIDMQMGKTKHSIYSKKA